MSVPGVLGTSKMATTEASWRDEMLRRCWPFQRGLSESSSGETARRERLFASAVVMMPSIPRPVTKISKYSGLGDAEMLVG
jgi:hypothetical protein